MLSYWTEQDGSIGVQPRWSSSRVRALFSFRRHPLSDSTDLDVAFHDRISEEVTLRNRAYVAEQLGVPLETFVFVRQVHQTDVVVVDEHMRGIGALRPDDRRVAADAMVTNVPNVTLAILAADCVPILFYDPVHRAIGAAHSGWRGTVGHIGARVMETMNAEFGTQPRDLLVSIGPSIRKCCYEVDPVVQEPASSAFSKPVLFPRFNKQDRFYFDMQGAIRTDLQDNGVPGECIEDTGICTSCRVNHLFSHRRESGLAGRQVAAISLVDAGISKR